MMYTTLNELRDHDPCTDGWLKLMKHVGKTKSDDERLSFKTILESNGLEDAIWALRTCEDKIKLSLFAVDCAERVLYLYEERHPDDKRPRQVIETARQFARGEIDKDAMAEAARDNAAAYSATAYTAAVATAAYWPTKYAALAAADAADAVIAYAADAVVEAADAALVAADAARDAAGYTTEDGLEAEKRAQEKLFIKHFC